jgi:membrane-bound lytic murein transglycosylase MltF
MQTKRTVITILLFLLSLLLFSQYTRYNNKDGVSGKGGHGINEKLGNLERSQGLADEDTIADEDSQSLSEEVLNGLNSKFTGDYDKMIEDRVIRILVPYSKTFYFFDGAKQRGLTYEMTQQFEKFINDRHKTKTLKIHAVIIPTARENLIPHLRDGKGDIAVGNLTITKERLKDVDFSDPFASGVNEIVVSTLDSKPLKSLFDLSGKNIHVRKSSSYYQSLLRLNNTLEAAGKKKATIIIADDNLEDEDLLEMLNADLIEYMIIDSHKGEFWAKIFDKIKLQPNIKLRTEGKIGWAVRKNNPRLKKVINEFVKDHRVGTLMGNILVNKYLSTTSYITDSIYNEHLQRFKIMTNYFKKYGTQYQFDYLMLAALGYQESKLDNSVRSSKGAVGVMQVLPSTAKDKNVGITNVNEVDPNIHAGTKYLRFMTDRYFADDEAVDQFNRTLFAFASYNAGPAKIARLRRDAKKMGLDPNKWFNNVEVVVAKQIGRETVQYVSNIFKYYVAYKLMEDKLATDGPVHLSGSSKKKKKLK